MKGAHETVITKLTKFTKPTKKMSTKTRDWFSERSYFVGFVLFVLFVIPVRGHAQPARFEELIGQLKSPEARERLEALDALREAANAEAIGAVAPLVSDVDDHVQRAAIATEVRLFMAEGGSESSIADLLADMPYSVYPRPVPGDLMAALLRSAGDESRAVRVDALYTLGLIARPPLGDEGASVLGAALRSDDSATRAAAARACGRLQAARAGDTLVALMNDRDTDVRLAAIWALGELRFERATQALTDFHAHYGTADEGQASLAALARIAHPSSAALFRTALSDRSADVRRLGAEGAGRLRDSAALPQVEQALASEQDWRTRAALLFALDRLGRPQAASIAMLLADESSFALAREYLRELGPSAVPALIPQLEHEEPAVRRGVVDVLGVIGGADMANTIWTRQQDPDQAVRDATARALERLRLRRSQS